MGGNGFAGKYCRQQKSARRRFFVEIATAYFLLPSTPKRLLKRSTRPPVSTIFCLPVKKGWQAEQTSRFRSWPRVERVLISLPQEHLATISLYSGWIPCFMDNLCR